MESDGRIGSHYRIYRNDTLLLHLRDHRVQNMDMIQANGIIQIKSVDYLSDATAILVTGSKPGLVETIVLGDDSEFGISVDVALHDGKCSVLVSENDWTTIKVCNRADGEVKFWNTAAIRSRGIIDIKTEIDNKHSVIKVRGISAGIETVFWTQDNALFAKNWRTVTISSLDLKQYRMSSHETELIQDRWNKAESLETVDNVRVRYPKTSEDRS